MRLRSRKRLERRWSRGFAGISYTVRPPNFTIFANVQYHITSAVEVPYTSGDSAGHHASTGASAMNASPTGKNLAQFVEPSVNSPSPLTPASAGNIPRTVAAGAAADMGTYA